MEVNAFADKVEWFVEYLAIFGNHIFGENFHVGAGVDEFAQFAAQYGCIE